MVTEPFHVHVAYPPAAGTVAVHDAAVAPVFDRMVNVIDHGDDAAVAQ
jgi:hypothetical protein